MAQRSADTKTIDEHHEDLFIDTQRLNQRVHIVKGLLLSCLLLRDMTRLLCSRCNTCKLARQYFSEGGEGTSSVHLCTKGVRVERSNVLHKQVLSDSRHFEKSMGRGVGWRYEGEEARRCVVTRV
jgi:hypothetical protein